jgi:hypothetical protein
VFGDTQLGRQRLERTVAAARGTNEPSLLSMTLRHLAPYCSAQPIAVALLKEAVAIADAARQRATAIYGLGGTAKDSVCSFQASVSQKVSGKKASSRCPQARKARFMSSSSL